MIAKSGEFKLPIDFENVEFTAPAVLIVFPEQVHNIIEVKDPNDLSPNLRVF
ncbi:MAG: hypothetical protein K0S31_3210 [Sphingobacterium multivorum]|jgi:hypothetical protein|nr:hypothetical protein [Sphingobacterium multivorum]